MVPIWPLPSCAWNLHRCVVQERAREEASEADPEAWRVRREAEGLDPAVRYPRRPQRPLVEQNRATFAQLLGVERPGKALDGQPQRRMSKTERRQVRAWS